MLNYRISDAKEARRKQKQPPEFVKPAARQLTVCLLPVPYDHNHRSQIRPDYPCELIGRVNCGSLRSTFDWVFLEWHQIAAK